jgi:hypothetical protein
MEEIEVGLIRVMFLIHRYLQCKDVPSFSGKLPEVHSANISQNIIYNESVFETPNGCI